MNRSELVAELIALRSDMNARVDRLIKQLGTPAAHPAREPPTTTDPDPEAPRPFTGAAMESKYAGKCCVCGTRYDIGAAIVYNRELKKAAHLGCGQREPRGHR